MASKWTILAGAAAVLGVSSVAMGQGGAVHAQAVEVAAAAPQASYVFQNETSWTYTLSRDDFDTYFTITTIGGPSPGQINSTMGHALEDNACNFFYGAPLIEVTRSFGGGRSVTCTPIPGVHAPGTGWSAVSTGSPTIQVPVDITDFHIQVMTVLLKTKRTGQAPWTHKYGFQFGTASIEQLQIEVVHEPPAGHDALPSTVLYDQLWEGSEVHHSTGDFPFDISRAILFGNDQAQAHLANLAQTPRLMSDILAADDFHGNDHQQGGRATISLPNRATGSLPTYIITAPGTYTFKVTGLVKGLDLATGNAHAQAIDVTLNTVNVNPCE